MKRRTFLWQTSVLSTGLTVINKWSLASRPPLSAGDKLYQTFKDPLHIYRPFVRWWWNGDKVIKSELSRELRLMKAAGIGGVEINPIKFPPRTEDMGTPSLRWLSDEWIDALLHTFNDAKSLDMTCDLIVGSGWPYGAEYLEGDEQAQLVTLGTKKLEGAIEYEASVFDLLKEADPVVSSPSARRRLEIISVTLIPDPFTSMDQVKDFTSQVKSGFIRFTIPSGKFVLYTLVKSSGFLEVINGAPGANGPVLNHYNKAAVTKYLYHMSDTIQKKIGPLSKYIRALFTDSMELEGANWTTDMREEFLRRRGYDIMPYLPYTQFKIGSMGNVYDYKYGAELNPEIKNIIQRVRYDFELTKAELLQERFIDTFINWCKELKVKSRAQAYGRGYFPLEGSLDMDIPESETWVKYGIGKEMPEADYRVGRGYTMVNKYVSSAAHLRGKRLISCEELTNTDMVFNTTLEIMKITGDLSVISGVTHPVFHGFNYSPPEAPFPGWVRYGTFINERNNWWPYFRKFTDYKARLSALLQQADMFADIAVLTPVTDMWTVYSAQNEPFPSFLYPDYISLIWETIHQNGSACDYISEGIIKEASVSGGLLKYGPRTYHTIFLIEVVSLDASVAAKLLSFIQNGGRVFCIETYPSRSLGYSGFREKDESLLNIITQMKLMPDRFILLKKPEKDFLGWFGDLQKKYNIRPYVSIDKPGKSVTQVRYQVDDVEMLFFINSSSDEARKIRITPSLEIAQGRQTWVWNPETGDRVRMSDASFLELDLGPADSRLIVFEDNKTGKSKVSLPLVSEVALTVPWTVEFTHINGTTARTRMSVLTDLRDLPEFSAFSGTAIYRTSWNIPDKTKVSSLNLGRVFGVCELFINGKTCGVQWYGRRIYVVSDFIQNGVNAVEVRVVTTMGNYLKTLKDNLIAQYWTNEKRKDQPVQSMGLVGPVTVGGSGMMI
ncbi:MAG: glycosyl hydrolase [Chitinophagaceae bacterium]